MNVSRAVPVLGALCCAGVLSLFAMSSRSAHAAAPAPVAPSPVVAAAAPAPLPAAPIGEQTLDTDVAPPKTVAPAPAPKTANRKVRTPSDEHLPRWVPVRGRLTVVESSDLAENLGLVPKGSSKKSEEPISVADKLEEERGARAAAKNDPSGTWSYSKPGRVRSRL